MVAKSAPNFLAATIQRYRKLLRRDSIIPYRDLYYGRVDRETRSPGGRYVTPFRVAKSAPNFLAATILCCRKLLRRDFIILWRGQNIGREIM